MKKLDKFRGAVNIILDSNTHTRKDIIRAASEDFIKFIGDISLNVLKEVIQPSGHYLNKLDVHFEVIRKIGSKRVKSKARKRLCVKHSDVVFLLLKSVYKILFKSKNQITNQNG